MTTITIKNPKNFSLVTLKKLLHSLDIEIVKIENDEPEEIPVEHLQSVQKGLQELEQGLGKDSSEIRMEAVKIINQAKRLEDSAALLFKDGMIDPEKYYISAWILAALSIELYLKAIALKENGSFKKIHNIDILFKELKPATKLLLGDSLAKAILNYDKEYPLLKKNTEIVSGKIISNNISEVLKDLSTLFVDFRYIFEKQQPRSFFYIEPVRSVLENFTKDYK